MHARCVLIAAATLIGSAAYAAEPVKPAAQPATQSPPRPAEVVLASADQVPAPAPHEQQATTPAKSPRVGRVTTCRCGDLQPQPEQ